MLRSDRVRPVAADARTYHLVQVEQLYLTTYIRLDLQQLVSFRRDDRHRHKHRLRSHPSYSYVNREDVQIKSLSRRRVQIIALLEQSCQKLRLFWSIPFSFDMCQASLTQGDPRLLSQCLFKED